MARQLKAEKKTKGSTEVAQESLVKLDILDSKGKKVGVQEVQWLTTDAKGADHLLYQMVRWQRAKKRSGTHAAKTRAEVSGGGAKPWRQKGTGRARAGSNTSPLWVGGGVAHGPKPHSYEFAMNKKERRKALVVALSERQQENCLLVVEEHGLSQIKTKQAATLLRNLGIAAGTKTLLILPEGDEIGTKSLRNLEGVKILNPQGLNVYDVLNARYVVLTKETLASVTARTVRS